MTFIASAAAQYLRDRFVDPPGLCFEKFGGAFQSTFWLMNDNALAVVAFDRLNDTSLQDKIKAKLKMFTINGHPVLRNQGWVDPFIHQGASYLLSLRKARCYRWNDSTKLFDPLPECKGGIGGIVQEEWDGGMWPATDEKRYPNLAASKALSWHKEYVRTQKAQDKETRDSFIQAMENLWDPTSLGFVEPGQNGNVMETYYLAAYLLVGEKTDWPKPFLTERGKTVKDVLNSLQLSNGGFATKYRIQNGNILNMDWEGNIETTSLGVYANIQPEIYTAF
jgi:hypothetical protein